MSAQAKNNSESRQAWTMVLLAALLMGMGPGAMNSIAVFINPITVDFGWMRSQTSFAYLAGSIALGTGSIGMGYLADRYSARPVVILGAIVLGSVFVLLAHQQALWQMYFFYMLLGGLGVSSFDAPLLVYVGSWFQRNKGLAMGVAMALRSLGQGLVPFVAGYLITIYGWRGAYMAMGLFALVVLVPIALLLRKPPAIQVGNSRNAAGRRQGAVPPVAQPIAPERLVAWIGAAAVFCCIAMATVMVHVVGLAQDRGLGAQSASGILLVIFIVTFFGRIAYGKLSDKIGGLRSYMIASAGQSLLVFWFSQADTLLGFYLVAAAFSLGFSGVMTGMVVTVREYVPKHRQGVFQGVMLFMAWIGMGIGGWQGGFFFDLTGGYTAPFAIAALAGFVNLAILASLYFHIQSKSAPAATVLGLRLGTA